MTHDGVKNTNKTILILLNDYRNKIVAMCTSKQYS